MQGPAGIKAFLPTEGTRLLWQFPHHGQSATNNEKSEASDIDDEEEDDSKMAALPFEALYCPSIIFLIKKYYCSQMSLIF